MKKRLILIYSLFFLVAVFCSAQAGDKGQENAAKLITLQAGQGPYNVPEGRVWKLVNIVPYKSDTGLGTADVTIDGQMLVGQDRSLTVAGKFDVLVNKKTHPSLLLLPGTKVEVGDSRQKLVVEESNED